MKFESEKRISMLKPKETLLRAGLKDGMVLCDIGAGTGLFTFIGAKITNDKVYALDVSDDMIHLLNKRKNEWKMDNVVVQKVDGRSIPLKESSLNMAIMITVLHEVADCDLQIKEIKKVLKEGGRLLIVEFHKKEMKMGPALKDRLSEEEVDALCLGHQLKKIESFDMDEVFYACIYEK